MNYSLKRQSLEIRFLEPLSSMYEKMCTFAPDTNFKNSLKG